MEAARALAASGATATMTTSARESMASGATAAMATTVGNGSRLEAVRATAVGGIKRGRLAAARAVAWEALVCQRPQARQSEGFGRRKREREVSVREGSRVGSFFLSASARAVA